MKLIFGSLLLFFYISSCQNNSSKLKEDYQALGFISNGEEVQISKDLFLNAKKFHYFLFLYHDTIFQVVNHKEITYYYFEPNKKMIDSLKSALKPYTKITLHEELISMKKNGYRGSCGPEGYFLFEKNEKMNFGVFDHRNYNDWRKQFKNKPKEIKKNKFPKIFQSMYHKFNSKHWDYFMSTEYHYKDVRCYGKAIFIEDDTLLN